jgi:hypothetical protein
MQRSVGPCLRIIYPEVLVVRRFLRSSFSPLAILPNHAKESRHPRHSSTKHSRHRASLSKDHRKNRLSYKRSGSKLISHHNAELQICYVSKIMCAHFRRFSWGLEARAQLRDNSSPLERLSLAGGSSYQKWSQRTIES